MIVCEAMNMAPQSEKADYRTMVSFTSTLSFSGFDCMEVSARVCTRTVCRAFNTRFKADEDTVKSLRGSIHFSTGLYIHLFLSDSKRLWHIFQFLLSTHISTTRVASFHSLYLAHAARSIFKSRSFPISSAFVVTF